MMLVIVGVLSIKAGKNPISDFISSIYDRNKIDTTEFVERTFRELLKNKQELIINDEKNKENEKPLKDAPEKIYRHQSFGGNFSFLQKDKSEKIADSIATVIVSFSLLLFIGYVMRVSIVFIKYYMQLGNDYENQKIAFMLSKNDTEEFKDILQSLRTHNITFDKTPSLPQEKIISSIIGAINSSKQKE